MAVTRWKVGWRAGSGLVLTLALGWLFYDPPLGPGVAAVRDQSHPFDDNPRNAYWLLAGMGQPEPVHAGRAWVAAIKAHEAAGADLPWPVLPQAVVVANDAMRCDATDRNCWQAPPPATTVGLASATTLATHYASFLALPVYSEFVLPSLNHEGPLPAFAPLAHAQQAFHARLVRFPPTASALLVVLQQERAGLAQMLTGSRTVISKLIALRMAHRHAFFVHDAVRAKRLPDAPAALAALTEPFSAAQVSLHSALKLELQMQLKLIERLPAAGTAKTGSDASRPLAGAWQWAFMRLVLKPQATSNHAHHQFQKVLALAAQADGTPPAPAFPAPGDWTFNPVGRRVLAELPVNLESYVHRTAMLPRLQLALNACRATLQPTVPVTWVGPPSEKAHFKARFDGDALRC
ncbi:MAG: hypothetical protein V4739_10245 [Pseudomonadota bacterium]